MRYSSLLLLLFVIAVGPQQARAQAEALCPPFSVNCPDTSNGSTLKFTANINPSTKMTFNWTVSAGKIIDGQGTVSITVDKTGFGNQALTATVEVGGLQIEVAEA